MRRKWEERDREGDKERERKSNGIGDIGVRRRISSRVSSQREK